MFWVCSEPECPDYNIQKGHLREVTLKLARFLAMILCSLVAGFIPARAGQGDITLTIMASPAGYAAGLSPGHAFFCITLLLQASLKEECYGFYPKTLLGVFVGGPGVVQSEFKKNPARFSTVAASDTDDINEQQRRNILNAVDEFNKANYKFTENNCIDFLVRVVQLAGWPVPPRSSWQTPVQFVNAVVKLQNPPGCTSSTPEHCHH